MVGCGLSTPDIRGSRRLSKPLDFRPKIAVANFLTFVVRPDAAYHQWMKDPSRELSIALVADERFGRVWDSVAGGAAPP